MPYPKPKRKLEVVTKYKLEAESIGFNLVRTKFLLFTKKEAEKCKTCALVTSTSQSPIYATRDHRLCLVELFRDDKEGTERTSRVEVSTSVVGFRSLVEEKSTYWTLVNSLNLQK